MQSALPLGPNDPTDLMGLGVSEADKDAVWSFQQAPRDEVRCEPLGFWNKVPPSSGGNYSPLEKQLLACYWTSAETEKTMGHQVTM